MTNRQLETLLGEETIAATAPCRVDLGGTLDISTFYYPLAIHHPRTFNIAISLRTRASISPFRTGWVKVSSRGFEDGEFPAGQAPYGHPTGLMFAIADYFQMDGIHIQIDSASPPRSALGGSSVAAVALIAAFNKLLEKLGRPTVPWDHIPLLAHGIEESVAGVPCGLQDQLAAIYGGVNAWRWKGAGNYKFYIRQSLSRSDLCRDLSRHLLVAYCGIPHESKNINGAWARQFVSGNFRSHWVEIIRCTNAFIDAFAASDIAAAVVQMNRETAIRVEMTPEVLDETGNLLAAAAREKGCGARFTGAGGGGCVWAIGETADIAALKPVWETILSKTPDAGLLNVTVDAEGLLGATG